MAATGVQALIILKLLPDKAVPADRFQPYIHNLTITAWDLSIDNGQIGTSVGTATSGFVLPPPSPAVVLEDTSKATASAETAASETPLAPKSTPTLANTIFQDQWVKPESEIIPKWNLLSTATALIVATIPSARTSLNVRFTLERNGLSLPAPPNEYNIPFVPVPADATFVPQPNSSSIFHTFAAYVQLPPPAVGVSKDTPYLPSASNGQPPTLPQVVEAVDLVLAKDPLTDPSYTSISKTQETALTERQCAYIAAEIAWNRSLNPLPTADSPIGELYTVYPSNQTPAGYDAATAGKNRQQFESNLKSYRSSFSGDALSFIPLVFSASAAAWCEYKSYSTGQVAVKVPVNTSDPGTVSQTTVVISGVSGDGAPSFGVPAAYFYVLSQSMSPSILPPQRYAAAITTRQDQLLQAFQAAVDSGAISKTNSPLTNSGTAVTPEDAAAHLISLGGGTPSSSPTVPMSALSKLLAPAQNESGSSWTNKLINNPTTHVHLLLHAITNGHSDLVDSVSNHFQVQKADDLTKITNDQWSKFFENNSSLLPEFTRPGGVQQRTNSFIQRLGQFIAVPTKSKTTRSPVSSTIPSFGVPTNDALSLFIAKYNGLATSDFDFSQKKTDETAFEKALQKVFPMNESRQNSLRRAIHIIQTLYQLTENCPTDIQFSVMEALYARGLTTPESIDSLTLAEFQAATTGTIAYQFASQILPKPETTSPSPTSFAPINAEDSLCDCIPPDHLSPFSRIQYLHELLELPFGNSTLGLLVTGRRGPVGGLLATAANLEIPLPLIDMVNESLEYLGSNLKTSCGAVYNTSRDRRIVAAIPEYSSPATPVQQPTVYETLRNCFTASDLPYCQALDICRTYLKSVSTDRFAVMRNFRRDITEFPIDAALEPHEFQRELWRLPVRFEIALEYLGVSSEEHSTLFSGEMSDADMLELLGLENFNRIVIVWEFLKFTGLRYEEFIELWKSKYVPFHQEGSNPSFPSNEPCSLKNMRIDFGVTGSELLFALRKLFTFVRLYRHLCNISFNDFAKVCESLEMFSNGKINRGFIRQLSALIMLSDTFSFRITTKGTEETGILGLWVDSDIRCTYPLKQIAHYSKRLYHSASRSPSFLIDLETHLFGLSILAGFTERDSWHANPTSTLRFSEILAKIYASQFTVGQILSIFSGSHLAGEDPFPLSDTTECEFDPLKIPDGPREFDLWSLRRKLLDTEIDESETLTWSWERIESVLLGMGTEQSALNTLKTHFFLGEFRRFSVALEYPTGEARGIWKDGPFYYDSITCELWVRLPVSDRQVLHQLRHMRQLTNTEAAAAQNLYFAPRTALAPFAFIFANFDDAIRKLTHEPSGDERFRFFQVHFALYYRRCELVAQHLADHVASVTKREFHGGTAVAWKVLHCLLADENRPRVGAWENDSGEPPKSYLWNSPSGSALSALLGLTGTGLVGDFQTGSGVVWREVSGDLTFFGKAQNHLNCPVPTIIPSLTLTLPPPARQFATVYNGFAIKDNDGEALGGAEPFSVCWKGVLLIERPGVYTFHVGGSHPDHGDPEYEAHHNRWFVRLQRGQRTWTIIDSEGRSNDLPTTSSEPHSLLRSAYNIEIFFEQRHPMFVHELGPHHLRTGFHVKYCGPDTAEQLIPIPVTQLFRATKDNTLAEGIVGGKTAHQFLEQHYTSTLRDIRRTYQRAFKAILFSHGFSLSAKGSQDPSELSYILHHQRSFAGVSYYRSDADFLIHRALFDFNFLPVTDPYLPPKDDSRQDPSMKRQAALFDWWERIFDYTQLRQEVRPHHLHQLFYDAAVQDPSEPDQLLPYLDIDISLAPQVLNYFASDPDLLKFTVSTSDFTDEKWPVRVKHAGNWIRNARRYFYSSEWEHTCPYLWASDDPNSSTGQDSGNSNLTHFLQQSPQNHDRILRIDNALRERARKALLSYLCGMDRVALPVPAGAGKSSPTEYVKAPGDLTGLLLQDVEVGICQEESRIDNAISALHAFIGRSRLGLEGDRPNWQFLSEWDRRFGSFESWVAHNRREIYKENSVQWEEYEKSLKIESYRNLETQLRRSIFTIPKPGGLVSWSQPTIPTGEDLQSYNQAVFEIPLTSASQGFGLIAQPGVGGSPSWVGPETSVTLPLWMKAAAKLGTRFVRVAAALQPPSTTTMSHREEDAALVDEFYFWLDNSEYYDPEDASQNADLGHDPSDPDPRGDWDNRQDLPKLLQWKSRKNVLLHWCRIHFGKFDPPSCSTEGVAVGTTGQPLLNFDRREADSLFFSITNAVSPDGGFRYDLATDSAVVLPQVVPDVFADSKFPPPFKCYPYFVYFSPGAPLLPLSDFSTVMTIANTLRCQGRFGEALAWYEQIINPLENNNYWVHLDPQKRAILLEYLETLLQMGDASRESRSENAAVIFNLIQKIVGPFPAWRWLQDGTEAISINEFTAADPPLNPRLVSLCNRVQDRLSLIHNCTSHYFCDKFKSHSRPSRHRGQLSMVAHHRQFSHGRHPYRFSAVLSQAVQLAQTVTGFGTSLLSAFEKSDASYLQELQTTYDTQILDLALQAKENEWRSSDWEVQALIEARLNALCRWNYYHGLYGNGYPSNLNSDEQAYLTNMGIAVTDQTAASAANVTAEAMSYIPDDFAGDVGIAGPTDITWLPLGTKLSGAFATLGRIQEIASNIAQTTAAQDQTSAEWERRSADWAQQMKVIVIELEEIERQKLAADRRKAVALRELNSHRQQMENDRQIRQFMHDRFTKQDLYIFLQQEMSILYRRSYELAMAAARDAEALLYYEIQCESVRKDYLPPMWNNLREGLTTGERLQLALSSMERSYREFNRREYELSKYISLSVSFPAAFLRLKATGECQIDIPEWLFDLDYPGQYMRRIKTVSLTIPCVTGPYTGVNCKLQLLASKIRVSPDLEEGYDEIADDPRFIREYGVTEAIAMSTAQSDSGLFTLNFDDQRYLPFEFTGAISQWRIAVPPENNQFDLKTLTDVVIHLQYTSREGGNVLRRAANEVAQRKLPGNGWRLFDLRQDFADAWSVFQQQRFGQPRSCPLVLSRDMFPFLTGNRDPFICLIEIFIEEPSAEVGEHINLKYYRDAREEKSRCGQNIVCIVEEQCSGLFHGRLEIKLGPIVGVCNWEFGKLVFPPDSGDILDIYLLCRFGTEERRFTKKIPKTA